MPQLVKGGKYVFGWSIISKDGQIIIPPEACKEYNYEINDKVIIISGSKTSGGFSIIKLNQVAKSFLSNLLDEFPEPFNISITSSGYESMSLHITECSLLTPLTLVHKSSAAPVKSK